MTTAIAMNRETRVNLALLEWYVNDMWESPHGRVYLEELHRLARDAVDWGFKNHLAHGTPCSTCSPGSKTANPPRVSVEDNGCGGSKRASAAAAPGVQLGEQFTVAHVTYQPYEITE